MTRIPTVSSGRLPIYEGESVEVCAVGRQVSTEVTVTIVGTPLNYDSAVDYTVNSYYDSAVGIVIIINYCDNE